MRIAHRQQRRVNLSVIATIAPTKHLRCRVLFITASRDCSAFFAAAAYRRRRRQYINVILNII
jgi:hypothetical protein